jgi:UDPglucose--hexose-1-phosphate uridylyltransferase
MAELRWHPLIKDWVMIVSNRQDRPQMPRDWCPFCPGSGRVPDDYIVYKYDNDFPALSQDPPVPDNVPTELYRTAEAYGKCEVILYSPDHTSSMHQFSVEHIERIIDLWTERFTELRKDERIKYIFIFENRGEMVGVTMPHPHGQIYGYPFIPKKLELELEACREHHEANGACLLCDMVKDEKKSGDRVIFENDSFIVFLPFFTEYPYGIYIVSKIHKQNLTQFDGKEKTDLAKALKEATGTLDSLFGFPFPYMMCIHQDPVNSGDVSEYYHFHIEFFPPMRSEDKQKFNASSETGAWAHANTTKPEEKAEELRQAHKRFLTGNMSENE